MAARKHLETVNGVLAEIERLQALAEEMRVTERVGVISRIQEAIETYDLKHKELFGPRVKMPKAKAAKSGKPSPLRGRKLALYVKYRDGDNTWTGHGHQPRWMKERIAGGADKEDFRVEPEAATEPMRKRA